MPNDMPLCDNCRDEWAEAWLDGVPTCLPCVEILLDRLQAVYTYPQMREWLPGLSDK